MPATRTLLKPIRSAEGLITLHLNYAKTPRSRFDLRLDRCDFIIRTGELCVLFESDTESVPNQLMHSIGQHPSWSAKLLSGDIKFLARYWIQSLITVSTTAHK